MFKVTLRSQGHTPVTIIAIDADEHSLEPAITSASHAGLVGDQTTLVARFWNTGGTRRELVAVFPLADILAIVRNAD